MRRGVSEDARRMLDFVLLFTTDSFIPHVTVQLPPLPCLHAVRWEARYGGVSNQTYRSSMRSSRAQMRARVPGAWWRSVMAKGFREGHYLTDQRRTDSQARAQALALAFDGSKENGFAGASACVSVGV
jgi:hypothetical protein